MCLFSNDFPKEKGISVFYRHLDDPLKWIVARVDIPRMTKWAMQTGFLQWGPRLYNHCTWEGLSSMWPCELEDATNYFMPYFYKPKGYSNDDILDVATRHAQKNDYTHLMPFIWFVLEFYGNKRW